ncbi:hypothetical protein CWC02_06210 [Pseudoalteromonas sp. S2721]|uniref:hypothetical protein n=1 Tax=Pseudoalteromonas sp. S2721 TaxID=579526 RepID=UPI00110B0824|nr:hypothetical protein [Pseudoalteromonas sp. S2721]TMP20436.1 hypothetical protein CWC02_06210 [Pseudoalteromonas sp. S2721]
MKLLSSLDRIVPERFLAPVQINELIDYIFSVVSETQEITSKLEDIRNLVSNSENISITENVKNKTKQLLALIPAEEADKIRSSEVYNKAINALDLWEELNSPIGEQVQSLNEEIEFSKAHSSTINWVDIGLNVNATASFYLSLLQKDKLKKLPGAPTPEKYCAVNHDARAGYKVEASASGKLNLIKLGVGLDKVASIEFDSYYQVEESVPTHNVIWNMLRTQVRPWNLSNVDTKLSRVTLSGATEGYKAFSIKAASGLVLSGELGIGKSLATSTDIDGKLINIQATTGVTMTRSQELRGDLEFIVYRNTQQKLEILLTILEENQHQNSFKAAIDAEIKGMDALARQYVDILLGKGNELVKYLEENSNLGQSLLDRITGQVSEDKWYKPIAKLLFGQEDIDTVTKSLIDTQLKAEVDKKIISTQVDANELAQKIILQLLGIFDLDEAITTTDKGKELAEKAEDYLSIKIKEIQKKLSQNAEKFEKMVKTATKEKLSPLAVFGEEVANSLNSFDQNAQNNFDRVITKYQQFKNNILSKLEKAANIKLGLSLESNKAQFSSELHKLKIIINTLTPQVEEMYCCMAVGDSKKASVLIETLSKEKVIEVIALTTRLETILNSNTRLGLSIIGYDLNKIKDVNSDLVIDVDTNGNLYVKHEYRVKATASGLSECREANLSILLGVAQATQDPNFSGAIGLEYANVDNKLHDVSELRDFFASLDLSNNPRARNLPINIPTIVSKSAISSAVEKYTLKLNGPYTQSKISMSMQSGKEVFRQFETLSGRKLFQKAVVYLAYLIKTNKIVYNGILNILMLYPQVDERFGDFNNLFNHLFEGEDGTSINIKQIKTELSKLNDYKFYLANIRDVGYGAHKFESWLGIQRQLEKIGAAAMALKRFPATLSKIRESINLFEASSAQENAIKDLNDRLLFLSNTLEKDLDYWIDVNGILKNAFDDFWSKLGWGTAGINTRLLLLFLLLEDAIELETPLFLTLITLSNESGERVVIRV